MNDLLDAVSGAREPGRKLPEPKQTRWQPLRSGILQLFRFDEQEFWYEQGRLLLRGNNGAGKSRVLALQLPFLLDGELASHRVEPDRSPDKRMEWNLLLGKHKDRRGYTWLEFGRVDEDGRPHYLTIGCGLQAVEGRGITGRWFFLTGKRVGSGLHLQTANRRPITREQLIEQLEDDGAVYETSHVYRRAVDQKLFGLGEQRYEALIELLITLRQPQLSKTLNEEALSQALSDALPPLTQRVVDEIAEAMHSLELDREQLDSHRSSAQAIGTFLETYGRYARVGSRRKAETLRQSQGRFEATGRQLRTTQTELNQACADIAAIEADLQQLKIDEAKAETAQATLLSSPQMAAARELEAAKREADERLGEVEQTQKDCDQASQQLVGAQELLNEAEQRAATAREAAEKALHAAAHRAEPIGVRAGHDQVLDDQGIMELREQRAIETARTAIMRGIETRRREARLLRAARDAANAAAEALDRARDDRDRAAVEVDAAQSTVNSESMRVTDAVEAALSEYRTWRQGLVELRPCDTEDVASLLRAWAQSGVGASPLDDALRSAVSALAERIATSKAELESLVAVAKRELQEMEAQRASLRAGRHEPPQTPHTRSEGSRDGRAGAPLWALCEFRDSVPDTDRAGIEAALEAAGLLDAWVLPSGRVLDPGTLDTLLTADVEGCLPDEQSLWSVLRPSADRNVTSQTAVDEGVVGTVLRMIGMGPGLQRTSVRLDGTWRNGPLSGRWSKPVSEHIGASAREARRLRRLAELDVAIRATEDRLRAVADEDLKLDNRRQAARAEEDAAPRGDAIREGLANAAAARRRLEDARARAAQLELVYSDAREKAETRAAKRDETARDLGLSSWIDRIEKLEDAITQYRDGCVDLWTALGRHLDGRLQVEIERLRCGEAEASAVDRRARAQQATVRYEAANVRYLTLYQSKGVAAQEVVAALDTARVRLSEVRIRKEQTLAKKSEADELAGGLKVSVADLERQRNEHEQQRDDAVEAFRRFIATGVLGIAITAQASIQTELSATRLVEVAREVEQTLSTIPSDEATWERHQRLVFEQFKALEDLLLQHDLRPEMRPEGDVFVIRAAFQGRSCAVDELKKALEDEVSQRQSLLDARERQILENHLIGEVAQHLHDRLRLAEQVVQQMNAELERVPTNSGMVLKFRWEPREDGPPGLRDVRRRLLGAVGTWTETEREAVGRFLQDRIKAEQIANDTGTWQEHLTAALDYRAWHSFIIDRHIDGHWQRLTRRTHGTGSSGEKAIALMVPMFAAAASHYRSASPTAPRPILLDEAFAGIDPEMRARCAGLLRTFDLDFIMTSESEWCCYSTLPGVAICQFSTRKGVDGVYVSRLVWTGRARIATEDALGPADTGNGQIMVGEG